MSAKTLPLPPNVLKMPSAATIRPTMTVNVWTALKEMAGTPVQVIHRELIYSLLEDSILKKSY